MSTEEQPTGIRRYLLVSLFSLACVVVSGVILLTFLGFSMLVDPDLPPSEWRRQVAGNFLFHRSSIVQFTLVSGSSFGVSAGSLSCAFHLCCGRVQVVTGRERRLAYLGGAVLSAAFIGYWMFQALR